jgi:membrane protein
MRALFDRPVRAAGVATGTVLFFAMFKVLAAPTVSHRALWSGALVGALGFELLKQSSTWLLGATAQQPAFQAFGIALILLVWIYYFARVLLYAAAWAAVPERTN